MIDSKKFLAALAHRALSGEQLFWSSLVTDERVRGDVAKTINALRPLKSSANKSAAFTRTRLARVSKHLFDMNRTQLDHALHQAFLLRRAVVRFDRTTFCKHR